MEKKLEWRMSERLISYFASSIYGSDFDIIAVREALQNAVDAKATEFRVHIINDNNVVMENNGTPMTLDVIEKQLFTLGESTKTDGNETGFFGVGECAIIAPCKTWKIETNNIEVENFTVRNRIEHFNGTKHTLAFEKTINRYRVGRFLSWHNTKLKVICQHDMLTNTYTAKDFNKSRKYPIPHGVFTWVKSGDSDTIVRVNGVPQKITHRYDTCGTWVIDLDTSTVLTVNRETIRDDEVLSAVEKIQEDIRKVSEHVAGDEEEKWLKCDTPFPCVRKIGFNNRRDLHSKPVLKIWQALDALNDFWQNRLKKTIPISLCVSDNTLFAFVKEGTIHINITDRNTVPETTFSLQLIDDYCHELAHVTHGYSQHEQAEAQHRRTVWENYQIITKLRKIVREN